jgi:hypothetical protein
MYQVQVLDIGCGETALNPSKIEEVTNNMANNGYELKQVYVDSTQGCGNNKKSLIMIFRRV